MHNNKASQTATLIAKSIVFNYSNPQLQPLIPQRAYELTYALLQMTHPWQARIFLSLGRFSLARYVVKQIEDRAVAGITVHYLIRKLYLEELVRQARDDWGELKQLVILAAGLDTLGMRMAEEYPELTVFELDHPATQQYKSAAIANDKLLTGSNHYLLPTDFTATLPQDMLLKHHAFDQSKSTVIVAEGFFMYLPLSRVVECLQLINLFTQSPARFIFTYMTPNDQGLPVFTQQTRHTDEWLRRQQEPFIWGKTPQQLDIALQNNQFNLGQHIDESLLVQKYLQPLELTDLLSAAGENITWINNSSSHLSPH